MIHCCAPVPDAPTDRRNCLRQIHILCVRRSSVSHGSVHAPVQTSKLKHYIPSRELRYPTSKKRKIRTSSSQVPWCGICDHQIVPWRVPRYLHLGLYSETTATIRRGIRRGDRGGIQGEDLVLHALLCLPDLL